MVPYGGGQVLHSTAPYLVFWTPPGESIPATSEGLIARFLTDAAADSGKATNLFGVLRQYYDKTGFADYRQTFNPARQVIVDSQPYPQQDPAQCPDVTVAYRACVTNTQIQSELARLTGAARLPGWSGKPLSTAPIYFVILPADVATCDTSGKFCTGNQFCAGHYAGFAHSGALLFAVLPFQPLRDALVPAPKGVCQYDGTSVVQAPDGDVNADVLINALSHEYSETITDPFNDAWITTSTHNEIGDLCESTTTANPPAGFANNPNAFLPTLGGNEAAGSLFTQLINGDRYYTQSEWSNGAGNCAMRPSPGRITPRFRLPARVFTGMPVRFNPGASSSTNGYSSATWTFGDGKRAFFAGRKALTATTHSYGKAGRYTLALTLVDAVGNLQTATKHITVRAANCVVPNVAGEPLNAARKAITAANCTVGKVGNTPRPAQKPGKHKRWRLIVNRESPAAGSIHPIGTDVNLTVTYKAVDE
jgi:hypothetical protein